jgi:hypothetical protein
MNEKECIKAEFYSKLSAVFDKFGWFVVCPADGWMLVKYDLGVKDRKSGKVSEHNFGGLNEYTIADGGLPILRRAQLSIFQERHDFVINNLELGPISDDEFTLSAYGLPEIGGRSRRNVAPYWYLGLGAAGLILALAIRQFFLRNRKT